MMNILAWIAMVILIAFVIIATTTVYCCIKVEANSEHLIEKEEIERPDLIQLKK